jgi:hypothetical protein
MNLYELVEYEEPDIDGDIRTLVESNPNMTVPHYLMSSYLYYHEDSHYISDGTYDWMCKYMMEHWDNINHVHKHIIDHEALMAGTGFYLGLNDYPTIVKNAAKGFMKSRNP